MSDKDIRSDRAAGISQNSERPMLSGADPTYSDVFKINCVHEKTASEALEKTGVLPTLSLDHPQVMNDHQSAKIQDGGGYDTNSSHSGSTKAVEILRGAAAGFVKSFTDPLQEWSKSPYATNESISRLSDAIKGLTEHIAAKIGHGDYGSIGNDASKMINKLRSDWTVYESSSPFDQGKGVGETATLFLPIPSIGKVSKLEGEVFGANRILSAAGKAEEQLQVNSARGQDSLGPFEHLGSDILQRNPRNKVLTEAEMDALGGTEKLERMNAADLEALGIRRFDLPKLKLKSDEFSFQATIPGDNMAFIRARMPNPGIVEVTSFNRGALPGGAGGEFLAQTLREHNALPSKQLIFSKILNEPTLRSFKSGEEASTSVLGKAGTRALESIKMKPKAYKFELFKGRPSLIIDME
jgi:hypothetical protein